MGLGVPGVASERAEEELSMNKQIKGALVAAAVAGLFFSGTAIAADQPAGAAKVKCQGVNEC